MLKQQEIEQLIKEQALLKDFCNLEIQLSQNNIYLTVGQVFTFNKAGALDFSNNERVIPEAKEILPQKEQADDKYGWWQLNQGAYKIITNEKLNLPQDLIAIAFPRKSLVNLGVTLPASILNSGFKGKINLILTVAGEQGLKLKENARISQLIFIKV